jgi:hypothetical protein
VVLGEIGLAGEVRQVSQTPRRLAEAARLGFTTAVLPDRGPEEGPLKLCRVATLADALARHLGIERLEPPPSSLTVPLEAGGAPDSSCRSESGTGELSEGDSGRIGRWNAPAPP